MAGCGGDNSTSGGGGGPDTGVEANFGDSGNQSDSSQHNDSGNPTDSSAPDTFVANDSNAPETPPPTLNPPTFNPPSGAVPVGSTVTIVPPTPFPSGAVLLYTNNGTVPGPSNPQSLLYSNPIQINANVTLLAVAADVGYQTSSVATGAYTVIQPEAGTLTPPAFNPTSQTQPNDFTVALSTTRTPARSASRSTARPRRAMPARARVARSSTTRRRASRSTER